MTQAEIRSAVQSLKSREKMYSEQLKLVQDGIRVMQHLCTHEKEKDHGHGHNDNMYECMDCGRVDFR